MKLKTGKMRKRSMLIVLKVLFLSHLACADVTLPALFADNMVLQQKEKVAIWGWAAAGEEIEIQVGWSSKVLRTTADDQGDWNVRIRTPKAGGPIFHNL